jgi:hypothetical protein
MCQFMCDYSERDIIRHCMEIWKSPVSGQRFLDIYITGKGLKKLTTLILGVSGVKLPGHEV